MNSIILFYLLITISNYKNNFGPTIFSVAIVDGCILIFLCLIQHLILSKTLAKLLNTFTQILKPKVAIVILIKIKDSSSEINLTSSSLLVIITI